MIFPLKKRTLAVLVGVLMSACATSRVAGAKSTALPPQPGGALAELENRVVPTLGPQQSGFKLLPSADSALRTRLALIDSAQHTIDLQTFLWWDDASGDLILRRLIDAADRGVKVRLIIDDLSTISTDGVNVKLRDHVNASIDAHPNIELRVFNPWSEREVVGRAVEILGRLDRLNHRMHNKVLVADNRAVIMGGRNLGNEYLGMSEAFNFLDLDVIGIGPAARQGSGVFDAYWNSSWVVPMKAIDGTATIADLNALHAKLRMSLKASPALQTFHVEAHSWAKELDALAGQLHPGTSRIFTDSPDANVLTHHMPAAVRDFFGSAEREVLIANAYIIPGEHAFQRTADQIKKGVKFRMLTNSLASGDVAAVNSHYKQWRRRLLEIGVDLHEIRHDAAVQQELAETAPMKGVFMGLHMKALVVDRKRVLIGSMNLDPRSWALNSEMGLVIESPELAEELARLIEHDMEPQNAWRLSLGTQSELEWRAGEQVLLEQPARNFGQRVEDTFFMLFPRDLY